MTPSASPSPPDAARLAPELEARLDAILEAHGEDRVGVLLEVQEALGYLPEAALAHVASRTGAPLAELWGLATFYRRFRTTPRGRHAVAVCVGTACHVAGAEGVVDALARRLDVKTGGTTADGEITLETVACVGCCSLAPVLQIDGDTTGHMRIGAALEAVGALGGET
jgi:NADH-quinone oxidoreductase subunit E